MPKYLVKPSTTNEWWTVEAVVLELDAEDIQSLLVLREKVKRVCEDIRGSSITFYHIYLQAQALESLLEQPELSEWAQEAEAYEFQLLPDTFDSEQHKTCRTDNRIVVGSDGDIWVIMQNHYGDGVLEIMLNEALLKLPTTAANYESNQTSKT